LIKPVEAAMNANLIFFHMSQTYAQVPHVLTDAVQLLLNPIHPRFDTAENLENQIFGFVSHRPPYSAAARVKPCTWGLPAR